MSYLRKTDPIWEALGAKRAPGLTAGPFVMRLSWPPW